MSYASYMPPGFYLSCMLIAIGIVAAFDLIVPVSKDRRGFLWY